MTRTLAELNTLVAEYAAVAYPNSSDIDHMSEDEIRRNTATMHASATRIADLVIEAGVHRGVVLR
ncbi:hypothetical protein [Actinoplanes rectilineatus]|uniref:hypothetical protein n=1 Tax=Actinoplanes rectilineatus TaxID=113571 RepID=UPI0005F29086|nr:hypothetical protein [Actinoplanes rectilineatus]